VTKITALPQYCKVSVNTRDIHCGNLSVSIYITKKYNVTQQINSISSVAFVTLSECELSGPMRYCSVKCEICYYDITCSIYEPFSAYVLELCE
jgi:hypothetical protein